MRSKRFRVEFVVPVLVVAAMLAAWCVAAPADEQDGERAGDAPDVAALIGTWAGEIKVPGQSMRVTVRFADELGAPGEINGTMDIPQQMARGLLLEEISIEGATVRFALANVPGNPRFEGELDGDRISGSFLQHGMTFPMSLERGEPETIRRPQDPQPPLPYRSEDVRITSGEVALAGTLTLPPGDGPFPAVVFLTGSGPQNRNLEIFDHRPFLVLADHLTRGGIAVLRYDDRGVAESTGSYAGSMLKDYIADAEASLRYLQARPEIGKVGMLGLSEGGVVAAAVAAKNRDVAFVVLMASPGVSGAELLVEQNRRIAVSMGATAKQAAKIAAHADALFKAALNDEPKEVIAERMRDLVKAQTAQMELSEEAEQVIEQQVTQTLSDRFIELLRHDPRPDLRQVRVPVLALNGSNDVQVDADQNLPAIEAALREAGNDDVTLHALPGLNHLFQPSVTGGVHEYATIEVTMDPAALEMIRQWIADRFLSRVPD